MGDPSLLWFMIQYYMLHAVIIVIHTCMIGILMQPILTVGSNNVTGGRERYDCHVELTETVTCIWLKDGNPIFESNKYHIVNVQNLEQSLTFCRLYVSGASQGVHLCYIFLNNTICDHYDAIKLSKKGNYLLLCIYMYL